MNQTDINSGIHSLPTDCYPPTDSDDESFVVLERSSGPDFVNESNFISPEIVERSIDHASDALMFKSSLPSMPPIKNACNNTDIAISMTMISTDLSHQEIQEKVDLLIEDNIKLKETLHQNNLAMKSQYDAIVKWQTEVEVVYQSHKDKYGMTKDIIKQLKCENATLTKSLEKCKLEILEFTKKNEETDKVLSIPINNESEEKIKLLQEQIKEIEAKSQTDVKNLKTMYQNTIEELVQMKVENVALAQKIEDQNQAMSINFSKLSLAGKVSTESDFFIRELKQQIADLQTKSELDMEALQKNHQFEVEELQKIIVEQGNMVEEIENAKKVTLQELTKLKMANDILRNNAADAEELDILKKQLMASQVFITDLRQSKKCVETEADANRKKIDELEKVVADLTSDKDRVLALDEQLALYKTDFEAERECKNKAIEDKNKLAEDLHHIQRRNQELTEEVEGLRERSTFVEVNGTRVAMPTAPAQASVPVATYACPRCNFKFSNYVAFENHVYRCIELDAVP